MEEEREIENENMRMHVLEPANFESYLCLLQLWSLGQFSQPLWVSVSTLIKLRSSSAYFVGLGRIKYKVFKIILGIKIYYVSNINYWHKKWNVLNIWSMQIHTQITHTSYVLLYVTVESISILIKASR